jgi:hypothetical protein
LIKERFSWRFVWSSPGKLTEGLTEFALKDGKFHSKVKLDALMPGKTAPHLGYDQRKL